MSRAIAAAQHVMGLTNEELAHDNAIEAVADAIKDDAIEVADDLCCGAIEALVILSQYDGYKSPELATLMQRLRWLGRKFEQARAA